MDEITQKNIILISTCLIVICFHLAYKFRNNLKLCKILLGIGFFISLIVTKILHSWEKENKVDYNLVLFVYLFFNIIIFFFLIFKYCEQKGIMRGGGEKTNFIDELKQQDFVIKEMADSPFAEIIGERLKENVTDYIVRIISKIKIF